MATWIGLSFLLFVSWAWFFYFGARMASQWCTREWRESTIARDVARYHPKTGKWEWTIEPKPVGTSQWELIDNKAKIAQK